MAAIQATAATVCTAEASGIIRIHITLTTMDRVSVLEDTRPHTLAWATPITPRATTPAEIMAAVLLGAV